MKRTFKTTIVRDGAICFIPIPFDPKPVFGKLRAPVKVSLRGHTYRSTIASMGQGPCLPLRRAIEGAKKAETRARRIAAAVRMAVARPPRKQASNPGKVPVKRPGKVP
jgi:hypothetical protein